MKKVISCLLVVLMMFSIVPVATVGVNAAGGVNSRINSIKNKFPSGTYFTANGASCGHASGSTCNNCKLSNVLPARGISYNSSVCPDGWTCYAFASYCFGTVFGQSFYNAQGVASSGNNATNSTLYNTFKNAKTGDFLYLWSTGSGSPSHYAIFISCDANGVTIYDNNIGGNGLVGKIRYGYINYSNFQWRRVDIYRATNYSSVDGISTPSDTAPIGVVDSITGKTGAVHVRGWAFDKDRTSTQIPIHVYIGSKLYSMTANKSRPDVHNVYGCGSSHGFEATIYTNLSGSQSVRVYALSVNSSGAYINNNPLIGSKTVTITKDSSAPVISDATYTKTDTGYTVKCKVSDNVKVDRVQFPTWTTYNGQDDLNSSWSTDTKCKGTSIGNGYYKFDVKISDHNNEKGAYITDIYAYDKSGNMSACKTVRVDLSKKSISSCSISLAYTSISYRAVAIRPKVTIKNGSTTLVANTDYTVAYSNNINVGTATATITGKGNYTGTVKKTYTITKKSFKDWTSKTKQIKYPATNIKTYWTMTMTTDGFKYKLVQDKDYTVSVKGEIKPGNTVKVTYTGKGNFKDAITYNFNITCGDNADGHNIVTVGKKNATYFAKGYTGDKVCSVCDKVFKKGKATAKLKLATPKVKIVAIKYPWGSEISVTLKKASKGATGYQVRWKCNGAWQYSDDINFNYWIFGIDESHLQRGKKHKVQVRAFVKSGSKKAYSNWTKAKTVKAK